ncbi:hypothetical protein [Nesterenkonia sp. HG001]|uniref:ATP-grasp domain-containing protein n=1 Tax=Nesterenkonia sp. HG001 TaxID=2983207 RepID=UPI002AC69664|nr:hypothetical protein [Nesterenkonia sp. HG001]MDZ5078152.1 hypothetical protein [Nesterenkonia sp. HG001]
MTAHVGVVVTDEYLPGAEDPDTPVLLPAMRAAGLKATPVVWHAHTPGDGDYDLLVLRSPWDYPWREAEFRAWLTEAHRHVPVLNTPALVDWNLDKVYLRDLEAHGVNTVPTRWATTEEQLRAALDAHRGNWVVLKPTVSAGALHTGLLRASSEEALDLGRRILAEDRMIMVQPEVPELSAGAEKALYFIDGRHTHTISKGAILARGGGLAGGEYSEDPQPVTATAAEADFAESVMAAIDAASGAEPPLYARIDLVTSAEWGIVLLEAELFEPALNLHRVPEAATALAAAIVQRVGARAGG